MPSNHTLFLTYSSLYHLCPLDYLDQSVESHRAWHYDQFLATSEHPRPLTSRSEIWRRRNPWEVQRKTRNTRTPCIHFWRENQERGGSQYFTEVKFLLIIIRFSHMWEDVKRVSILLYTRKNAQVVIGLQTSCYKSVHKRSTSCVRTACSQLL